MGAAQDQVIGESMAQVKAKYNHIELTYLYLSIACELLMLTPFSHVSHVVYLGLYGF